METHSTLIFFDVLLCYSLIIGNQRRYSSRLSILMFIETSCSDTKILIFKQIMLLIAQINLEWDINRISQIRLKSHVIIIVHFFIQTLRNFYYFIRLDIACCWLSRFASKGNNKYKILRISMILTLKEIHFLINQILFWGILLASNHD